MRDVILTKNREVKTVPPHFIIIPVQPKMSFMSLMDNSGSVESRVRNWCHENVENRFYIGKHVTMTDINRVMVESFVVGFEDEADATYFSLLLPNFLE